MTRRGVVRPWPTSQAREDGSWLIDERWDPFTRLPDYFRWWRRSLGLLNSLVEMKVTDDQRAVSLTVVLDGITRVPILANEVARTRIILK